MIAHGLLGLVSAWFFGASLIAWNDGDGPGAAFFFFVSLVAGAGLGWRLS